MNHQLKSKKPSTSKIILASLKYFAFNNEHKDYYKILIVILTMVKNVIKHSCDYKMNVLMKKRDMHKFQYQYISTCVYYSIWGTFNFLTDFIFEKHLATYGGLITRIVLKNIIESEDKSIYDIRGSEFEYNITEGAKSMAKICRFVLLRLISRIFHFGFSVFKVYMLDEMDYKIVTNLLICICVFMCCFQVLQSNKISNLNKKNMQDSYQKERIINENIENMAIIKTYKAEEHRKYIYNVAAFDWEKSNIVVKLWKFITDVLYYFLSCTVRPGLVIYYLHACPNNTINQTSILCFVDAITETLKTAELFFQISRELMFSIDLAGDILPFLEMRKPDIKEKIKVDMFKDKIELKDIIYYSRDKLIIDNACFDIVKGNKYGVYGRNGVGKSSISRIILGFDEYKGTIKFDGINLDAIDMESYRKLINFVPQDTRLYCQSIFFNLSFGNDKSYEEIIRECKKMKIHDEIMLFPEGYNTNVGEFGKNINGGLRQKIFYTRAFLRDAEIYIFDEPTNNLDANNSKFLLEYINDPLYSEKTFFVICHDTDIINQFPTIYKFIDGKVFLENNTI